MGLTELEWLELTETQITNAGLEHLTALAGLDDVVVYCTHVTEAGIEEFRKARPNCNIHWADVVYAPSADATAHGTKEGPPRL